METIKVYILEFVGGVRVELIGNFSSFLLVVASCYGDGIIVANCGVLGAVAAPSFGCPFMMPIFIFNIYTFRPLAVASTLLPIPHFGSTKWVGVSQWRLWPTLFFKNIEQDRYMPCQGHYPVQPPIQV